MIIAIPRETTIGENRVAVTPEQVKKYSEWGFQVKIETSAGTASGFDDDDYLKAGAEIAPDAAQTYQNADIILKIWAPLPDEDRLLKPGQTIIANFQALAHPARVAELAKQGLTCFALDMLPRISRAQSMDILSSQSNLAGYKAVINAVNHPFDDDCRRNRLPCQSSRFGRRCRRLAGDCYGQTARRSGVCIRCTSSG